MLLLLLHKPSKAVGSFRASPWYEQSCCFCSFFSNKKITSLFKNVWGDGFGQLIQLNKHVCEEGRIYGGLSLVLF